MQRTILRLYYFQKLHVNNITSGPLVGDLYRAFSSSTLRSCYVETHPQNCSYRHLSRRMS